MAGDAHKIHRQAQGHAQGHAQESVRNQGLCCVAVSALVLPHQA